MSTEFEPVVGLEIHAELQTRSKMFCACPVVDSTQAEPNVAVCPVCSGMPGVLPVINQKAVEYAIRVALALECQISNSSIFARKNYFYPDLPKGYQISQYEYPLAQNGCLVVCRPEGEKRIRIRRVHLEEDAGKLTHINRETESGIESHTLVDLNRAGVPLLEIVTEPDIRSAEEARACATALRNLLRYLGVNSGDLEKGVIRVEPNISVRPAGSSSLGTRTEIKNLNSFRALERSVAFEIQRQSDLIRKGEVVVQQTMGWNEAQEVTYTQRVKEGEEDYRYFPEPDLPPLVIEDDWIESIRTELPELPSQKFQRFQKQYQLSSYDTEVLVAEREIAGYFEEVVISAPQITPKEVANWVTGEIFGLMNRENIEIHDLQVNPRSLGNLLTMVAQNEINHQTAKTVLAEMFKTGKNAETIVEASGLRQISDAGHIAELVKTVLGENPEQVKKYLDGKETLANWFFGQIMRAAKGKANPQIVREELDQQLAALRNPPASSV
jgi:aspartyl-tRNA(Asn)/glutamyl-tRNA(Gln) amidotransferase subunit B